MIRNQDWYNANNARAYPLDDFGTLVDDRDRRLPHRMLVDLHLSFPKIAGKYAYLGSLSVTDTLVSVTILGSQSATSADQPTPLAAISLAQPIDPHRHYLLESLYPGVGGWVVFGQGAADREEFHGRFSSPSQSLLLSRTASGYDDLPIPSLGKGHNSQGLTGLVALQGGNDIEIVKECLVVAGNLPETGQSCDDDPSARDVIVIRLKDKSPVGPERNVFDVYKGPCGVRPESNSCGEPNPIELIGSVAPDCCGNITLLLRGCADLSEISGEVVLEPGSEVPVEFIPACGVVVDCGLGLSDACVTADRLPGADGRLPNEYEDLCVSVSEAVSVSSGGGGGGGDPPIEDTITIDEDAENAAANPSLPFVESFDSTNPDFEVQHGEFVYKTLPGGEGTYGTEGDAGRNFRNVSIRNVATQTLYRKVSATVSIQPSPIGARHNAAIVANYRLNATGTGHVYWIAEIDWDGYYDGFKSFRVTRYADGIFVPLHTSVPVPKLALEDRYRLSMELYPHETEADEAWVLARLQGITDPSIDETIGYLLLERYDPEDGKFGLASDKSAARFYQFRLENTADL